MNTAWKTDNYKFVGQAFDYAYANRLHSLLAVIGTDTASRDNCDIMGGDYWNIPFDGDRNKNGSKIILTPEEFSLSESVNYHRAKIDKVGECGRVGKMLGNAAAMTVRMHALRMFGNAFKRDCFGSDGKPWAAYDHPNVSELDGRRLIIDGESGVYSNLMHDGLSVYAIEKAKNMANRYISSDGLPTNPNMSLLLVSPELEADAAEICGKNGKYHSGCLLKSDPLPEMQYMVLNHGFNAKQWAVCDPVLMREMVKLLYITRPTVMQTALDNPLKDLYTAYVDFGCGWGDARQIIFSDPY